MKTISKIIITSVFLFVSLLILSVPSGVNAYMMPPEDIGGGSGGNPNPPVQPAPVINFVTNLNKTSFAPGETIVLSGSILRNACSNSTVNMKSEAYIVNPVDGDESHMLYNSLLSGGSSVPFSQNYTAPSVAGNYTMYAKATTYSAGYFWVEIDGNFYSRFNLIDLITLLDANYTYSAGPKLFVDRVDSTKTYIVSEMPSGTVVLNNIEKQINFTVVALPSVSIEVAPGGTNKYSKSITVNTGDSVKVRWTASNVPISDVCNCKCMNGTSEVNCGKDTTTSSCGTGKDTAENPVIITNLLMGTTFKVSCGPNIVD
jgi:hypothetical protein